MNIIKAARGTRDLIGVDGMRYNYIIDTAQEIFGVYGYDFIKLPIFESTDLFVRGIGEGTDVVSKEMYTFEDKGGRSLTLRPEGTASVVRAYLENKIYGKESVVKYYYFGPMFRYERPQAGRQREFNQLGVEVLGEANPLLDSEVITMSYDLLKKLEIDDITVQVNYIGGQETREKYRKALIAYLNPLKETLCKDCQSRYENNPLRVLDCKVDTCKEAIKDAPIITDFLNGEESAHYEEVKKYLEIMRTPYVETPTLVRGLDYYTGTVYEITTTKLGAQSTVLGGGRYDNLVEELGGKSTPAFGFAAGIERLMLLVDKNIARETKVFISWSGEEAKKYAFNTANYLRKNNIDTIIEFKERSIKSGIKQAERLNAEFVIIIGEEEVKNNNLTIKNLKERTQVVATIDESLDTLK